MRATVIHSYGDAHVLTLCDQDTPKPLASEILVEVHACGLNPVDYKIREGALKDLLPTTFPRILGADVSGVVRGLGEDVTDFAVGDEVYFAAPLDKDGGYAEYCTVDARVVAKKPKSLTHVEAASLPIAALTTLQALRDFAKIGEGSKVLVHAAAGGVGSFAVQYAKAKGAFVFATASASKCDYVRSLGACRVIDYQNEDFVAVCEQQGGMDIVFETVGDTNYPKSILATRAGGYVPCIVNGPDSDTAALASRKQVTTNFVLVEGKRADLDEITALIDTRAVRSTVSEVIGFDDLQAAHEKLESGRTQGKIVLQVKH